MVAGIFDAHGVWTGPCTPADDRNPRGYFESTVFRPEFGDRPRVPREPCKPVPGWRTKCHRILRENGYISGPWLVKYSVFYWPIWACLDPYWICVRRNPQAQIDSAASTGFMKDRKLIAAHIREMDFARDRLGAVDVYSDQIVAGDYSSLRRAFDYCGLKMDGNIVAGFVDPGLWHHK